MTNFENAFCRITVTPKPDDRNYEEKKGTGFFIDNSIILTSDHILYNSEDIQSLKFTCHTTPQQEIDAEIIARKDKYDMALLRVKQENFKAPKVLKLVSSRLFEGNKLKLRGYPNTENERITGVEIRAEINSINNILNGEIKHDLLLNLTDNKIDHKGLSGSPLLNSRNDVVGIFKGQGEHTFEAVSIQRAKQFLLDNKCKLKPDCLECFSNYKKDLFDQYEDIKDICENKAEKVVKQFTPQSILESKKGELFYPPKENEIDEIIAYLKQHEDVDQGLWKGWVELLTVVNCLKTECEDVNCIQIPLSIEEVKKRFGLLKKKLIKDTNVTLTFYFSEKDSFKRISCDFVRNNNKDLKENTCYIFNSHQSSFGLKSLDYSKIIRDISEADGSVPSIHSAYIGILSLHQLRDEMINSKNLKEVTFNLKKVISDAIK